LCGIVGIASNYLSDTEKAIFSELMLLSSWRGSESSGVLSLKRMWDKDKKEDLFTTKMRKDAVDPWTFVGSEDMKAVMDGGSTIFALGHTRAPTQGKVVKENSHPFSFSNVIGVHNGTIHGKFPHRDEFETDSESLYKLINEVGIDEALKEINNLAIEPAYALVFYDRKAKTLNFIRNEKRPLFLAWNAHEGTMFWASEYGMIRFVLDRRGVKLSEKKGFTPFLIPPHELFTFNVGKSYSWVDKFTKRTIEIKRPTYHNYRAEPVADACTVDFPPRPDVKPKIDSAIAVGGPKAEVVTPFPQRTETIRPVSLPNWQKSGKNKGGNGGTEKKEKKETALIAGETFYGWYNGDLISTDILLKRLHENCAYCQKTSTMAEYQNHEVIPIAQDQYLCEDCATDPMVANLFSFTPGRITSLH
jgi:hypothetical protein